MLSETNISKTEETKKLTVDGLTKVYPVYKIRISELYYNDQNDRIATWISKYKADNNVSSIDKSDIGHYNDVIAEFIKKSDETAFKKTMNNIKAIGQQEPIVVLNDGRVIDGNRRFTCIRELSKDDEKFNYIEGVLIDKDIEESKKEIKLLELYLQHGREERVGYNPIDKLVGVYNDIIENELISIKEYARNTEQAESEVKNLVNRAVLMAEFLEFINMPKHFYIARELELDGPISEINMVLNKVKDEEQREDLKNVIFNFIMVKPGGDMTRYIRDIKKLINTRQFEPFLNEQLNHAEKVQEKIEEEDKSVDLKFLNEEIRGDTDLVEEISDSYDKYQEKIKRTETKSAPKKQLEKAIEAIQNIDNMILISLDDEKITEFLETLSQLEGEVKGLKDEVDNHD
ncbi:ParB N-terminal domain-containing protein [Staphylococcus equorum]|uniref:ParB/Sulfiredoxin domain-containing protein n=1 Tax=Staphylococcus equorum TaxID=246432 RepID=A0AAP7IAY3_9STAP|nr:ParB/RepB/Spo0J family partition protein [Staphylococcus equorum]MDK9864075.1 ParB/RepB/Spo0J family partition protein [Staphylococcus equorum]OEK50912.1 hypothetical protein ASS94_14500 [Staphylococcus equorum]OEK53507.1 hypothetical protein ASS97_11210 [Staphylococcus equorum]OEK61464.1 hypothetical protein ASS99_09115 [Staphylococcus equorum]OEK64261.1 hypothetical protein ASS98_03635 [Staphylococcus equorum]